jgi:hypothetical protein
VASIVVVAAVAVARVGEGMVLVPAQALVGVGVEWVRQAESS